MKTIKFTISALCLFLVSLTSGQTPICTDFNSGSLDGWQTYGTIASISSPGPQGSYFLKLIDDPTDEYDYLSWAYNSTSYPRNWAVQFIDHCLCFDFNVLFDNHFGYTQPVPVNITIYSGADPQSPSLRATFISNTITTDYDGWEHVCAPIRLSNGSSLPTNADGHWTMTDPTQWNTLLSHVGGIAFSTYIEDISYAIYPIDLGVDNICIVDCSIDITPTDQGAYCCDGDNLVINGNFEFGDNDFSSSYSIDPAVPPGHYSVTNSAAAFGTYVIDHSYCEDPITYAANSNYLLVNGKTQKSSNAVIWEQTISGLDINSTYKFCANFQNMPQCTFDILPSVNMRAVGIDATGFSTVSAGPGCTWVNKELNFNTGTNTSVTLRIILDQTGNGDGNDLAIDDISVTKLIDPDLHITVQHQGNPQEITASINTISNIDDALHGTDCEYHWWVAEVTNYPSSIPPSTFESGNASGSSVGTSPWNLTTTFPDYTFSNSKLYMIGLYTPVCGCYDEGFTYQLTYNSLVGFEMTEEMKQQIIDWILNGTSGNNYPIDPTNQLNNGSSDLNIYPNPVEDSFTITLVGNSLKSVEVVSLAGQTLLTKNYTDGNTEEILDISKLASGIYLVKVYGIDDKQYTTKIVKE